MGLPDLISKGWREGQTVWELSPVGIHHRLNCLSLFAPLSTSLLLRETRQPNSLASSKPSSTHAHPCLFHFFYPALLDNWKARLTIASIQIEMPKWREGVVRSQSEVLNSRTQKQQSSFCFLSQSGPGFSLLFYQSFPVWIYSTFLGPGGWPDWVPALLKPSKADSEKGRLTGTLVCTNHIWEVDSKFWQLTTCNRNCWREIPGLNN